MTYTLTNNFNINLPQVLVLTSQTAFIVSFLVVKLRKTDSQFVRAISFSYVSNLPHPRRPRGSQSRREKRRNESFQVRAKEPLGTDSHRTTSKNSSRCRLLIGHKKCFVLLSPIGEQFLLRRRRRQ